MPLEVIEGWECYAVKPTRESIGALITMLDKAVLFDSSDQNTTKQFLICSAEGTEVKLSECRKGRYLRQRPPKVFSHLPFITGVAGYLSYDFGNTLSKVGKKAPKENSDRPDLPDYQLAYYSWSYIEELGCESGKLIFSPACEPELKARVLDIFRTDNQRSAACQKKSSPIPELNWTKNVSPKEYRQAFAYIKEYILAGDVYQANLTQRYSAKFENEPNSSCLSLNKQSWKLYESIRKKGDAHYGGFVNVSAGQNILSFSPEQFIGIEKRKVTTKPIKGTSDRTQDIDGSALLNSTKDRAENLMIVDLLRNDLSKVCESHSVVTPKLFDIENYGRLNHMVSTVEGSLKEGVTEMEALLSCFPGGSITGAPKKRSMEVINELEQHPRSAYCGTMFYLSDSGKLDSNILIRSIVHDGDTVYCWSGGGIVADSTLEDEYQESINKVQHITGIKD